MPRGSLPFGHLRGSLQARLVGSFLALSFITLTVVSGVAYRSARDSLRDAVLDHLVSVSALKERELNRWVSAQTRVLEIVAAQPGVRRAAGDSVGGADHLRVTAELLASSGSDFVEVFFLSGIGGRVVASTDPERVGEYHTPDRFFTEGRLSSVSQNVYPSPTTGLPTLTIAVPVRTGSGALLEVLAAHLNLDRLEEIVEAHTDELETTESYLVTSANEVLSADGVGLAAYRRGAHSAGITSAISGRTGVGLYDSYEGVPVIGAYRWIPERELGFLVEISQQEAFAPARRLMRRIMLFGAGATLLLLLGVRFIAVSVTKPINAVGAAAAMVASGDFTARAPERGEDEVGALARSFNAMTDQLRSLYRDLERQITVSARTLVALEESRSLLESIVDNSTALIAVTDPGGRVEIANRPFLELLGLGHDVAVGRPLAELLPTEVSADWLEASDEASERATVVEREFVWDLPDGARTYLCVWFPLLEGGERRGTGLIATDLTERKRVEAERLRLETQFRHAQKMESLGVLAGGIAHDFNNILAAVMGHADLAAELTEEDPEASRDHVQQVVAAARRAAELTHQMLAYAGKASFRVESLDLNESIREIAELISVSLPKKVVLRPDLCAAPLPVRGDPAQISQVVMNLVTNAAQAIGDAPGTVTISTEVSATGDGRGRAALTVHDNGCGMPDDVLDRIFDPFFTTKDQGRGLGLAAVLGMVNGLEGSLDVESAEGEGTTFRLFFPLESTVGPGTTAAVVTTTGASATGTILVVDDEDAVRSFTRRALERQGFSVLEARDGLHALEVYRQESSPILAVVLDMSMPGLGGREVFEILRRTGEEVPVLFTSGYDPSDAAGALLDSPNVRFLQKPYRPATLSQELELLISEVRPQTTGAPV